MNVKRKLGIWMDHSIAYLIEYGNETDETNIIESGFDNEEKQKSLAKSESLMHNKEQQTQHDFYKQLSVFIKNFDDIILFGPTDAKVELFNILKADSSFAKSKIEVEQTDKMTENQRYAYVRDYYSNC
jgi:hypothetical protein